ncbi:MAG: hypothetical protein IRZ28_05345 [Steroidobacteraceae bacterium]|jgi:hypothetical protein|nr:hypothetical protein [Steroidobacteraceae bacterium]
MTGTGTEHELQEFLARRASLYRKLAARDHSEPSPELDRRILEQARQALESPPAAPRRQRARWWVPASLAASLLVVLGVVTSVVRNGGGRAERAASPAPLVAEARDFAPRQPSERAASVAPEATVLKSPQDRRLTAMGREDLPTLARTGALRVEVDSPPVAHVPHTTSIAVRPVHIEPGVQAFEPGALTATAEAANASVTANLKDASSTAAPAAGETGVQTAKRKDPRAWLQRIERLRAEGRLAEAEREMAAYRQAFPGDAGGPAMAGEHPPTR